MFRFRVKFLTYLRVYKSYEKVEFTIIILEKINL